MIVAVLATEIENCFKKNLTQLYPIRYIIGMNIIKKTDYFEKWFTKLRDIQGKARILARLKRIELGNIGDHKSIGGGLFELRIDYGPGYRIYYVRMKESIIVLLAGGDKSTQEKDIKRARKILSEIGV